MHFLWKVKAEVVVHNKCGAALAGLRIDSDDRLVLSANVRRIDRQIRNLPVVGVCFLHVLHTLVDCVLVRTGESCKNKLADVWLTFVYLHACASFVNLLVLRKIAEIKLRVNSLGVHVKSHCNDIQVTCSFAVAEECSLHSLCSCEKSKLGSCYAAASVVMRVNTDNCCLSVWQVLYKIFNLVCVCVCCAHFNSVWQIEDNRIFFGCAKLFHNSCTDFNSVVHFCAAEAFR